MKFSRAVALSVLVSEVAFAAYTPRRTGQFDFPVYTNKPAGKQMAGAHAPASTPALAPEETRVKIMVPKGFEVRLFASEPEVVNPVAMTWDERGRLWVLELYEYPKGAPKGEKGRDRIKILEDTDADGHADKVTVFADGFSLATGLLLGNGGVYLGAAPNLYFLEDTNGDDKADKTTVLKTGFGMEDRHELLNGFAWGPDGWLYMTHGVFTYSQVKDPNDPDDDGVKMDAALARYHPRTRKLEVFADGTSNPWGVDWNERGDAFVSACVIQHLFHMAPGGQYNRQGGTWANPYGYVSDLPSKGLPAIVDWRHYRAAHAGLCVYQGDQYPAEWRGLVFLGNIHQSAINCDRLTPVGSTYKAEKESKLLGPSKGDFDLGAGNFLVSKDPWFRPVSVQTGPDGAMWVMDWYDKYPCYQNAQADPEGVDREHGRIWRVVWVGDVQKVQNRPDIAMNLSKLTNEEIIPLLGHANSWHRRQGQRLLAERGDSVSLEKLKDFCGKAVSREAALASFWALSALSDLRQTGEITTADGVKGNILDIISKGGISPLKVWAARTIGDNADASSEAIDSLHLLSRHALPEVRAVSAVALRQLGSGSLTVNHPPKATVLTDTILPHFRELLARPSVDGDFYYPHIVWMAMEPRVAANPQPFFPLLAANENSLSAYCTRRVMRRICDLTDATARSQYLNDAMKWLGDLASKTELAGAALDGLIEAQKSKGAPPTLNLEPIFAKLLANPAIADKARRLAVLLGDTRGSRDLIAKINDSGANEEDRLKGIQAAREAKTEAAMEALLRLLGAEKNQSLLAEAIRALNDFSADQIAYEMVDRWPSFSPPTRRVAAEVLVTRTKWARALLAGVDKKIVSPQDISATGLRALSTSSDSTIRDHAERAIGRYRASDAEKIKLIVEKKKVVLAAEPDLQAGHEVAKRNCFVCHKLHGEGADVGPDLTGVGRSTLDALLANVIDPNQVVGHGYENTEIETKDGRTFNGRVIEDAPTRIKLLITGPKEEVVARSDIARIRTSPLSLMPEGLEQIPDPDFRNMIWYILNPPQDNRPLSPAVRKELIGDEKPESGQKKAALEPIDRESVALWDPEWRVIAPEFEGTPHKHLEFAGRRSEERRFSWREFQRDTEVAKRGGVR